MFRGGVQTSALRSLATLRTLRGDAEGARRELARARAIQPQSPRGLYFAGRQAAIGGDVAEARKQLSELEAGATGGLFKTFGAAVWPVRDP